MDAKSRDEKPPSFGDLWGLPILFGTLGGVVAVFVSIGKLVDRYGSLQGALMGIALGFATSMVAIVLCRIVGLIFFRPA